MYSTTSSTCVQLASLLSRTPSDAEIDKPLAQSASKPASRATRADSPLWASIMKLTWRGSSIARRRVVRRSAWSSVIEEFVDVCDDGVEIRWQERADRR